MAFINGKDEKVSSLSPIAQQVFFAWDLDESEEHHDTHIIIKYMNRQINQSIFAHQALTKILSFHHKYEDIKWRQLLGNAEAMKTIENFRAGIIENLDAKIVHHVFDYQPKEGTVKI